MPSVNIDDHATEYYVWLIRQNELFVRRLKAALESGTESAAAVTATVRTRSEAKRASPKSDSTQGSMFHQMEHAVASAFPDFVEPCLSSPLSDRRPA